MNTQTLNNHDNCACRRHNALTGWDRYGWDT